MNPQIAELKKELAANTDRARALYSGRQEEQLLKRPDESRWSAAECVRHLTLTNRQFEAIFEKTLPGAPNGPGPFEMDFRGKLLTWVMEPPYRMMKVKTRPHLEPADIASALAVLAEFEVSQYEMERYFHKADGVALDKVKITSPYDGKTTYNLLSCFSIILSHQRRHLWQAEQTLKFLST